MVYRLVSDFRTITSFEYDIEPNSERFSSLIIRIVGLVTLSPRRY